MSDEQTKIKRSQSRKRNYIHKAMFENDNKGAFKLKVIDSRKEDYKRYKMRIEEVEFDDEYQETN